MWYNRGTGGIVYSMSTHAQIGVKMDSGDIIGCYVHYDGYPDHMVPAIEDYVKRYSTTGLVLLISRAIRTGGIRSFHIPAEGWSDQKDEPKSLHRETDFLDDTSSFRIDEHTWLEHNIGASYRYLIDYKTGDCEQWES